MITPERVELLQGMAVFGAVNAEAVATLLESATIEKLNAGEFFFRQGDAGSAMYVLESGEVAVLKSRERIQMELTRMGPGDCFGEMTLVEPAERSASVRAMTNCQAIRITSDDLFKVYEADVEQFAVIQMNLARELSRRLREANERWFERFGSDLFSG